MKSPAVIAPFSTKFESNIEVFDGYPSPEVKSLVLQCVKASEIPAELACEEEGAPIGKYSEKSYRLARAVGLVLPDSNKSEQRYLQGHGGSLAQGILFCQWLPGFEEGQKVLKLTIEAPYCASWGVAGTSEFCQELVKARCLTQYLKQVTSLLKGIAQVEDAVTVIPSFVGEWDASSVKMQEKIVRVVLNTLTEQKQTCLALA